MPEKKRGTVWKINTVKSDPIFANAEVISGIYVNTHIPELDDYTADMLDIKFIFHNKPAVNLIPYTTEFNIYANVARYLIVLALASKYIGDLDIYVFITK